MSTMLSRVTKGPQAAPLREMLYGVAGVGKTTFASQAPSPIFLGNEDGTNRLDVARMPLPSQGPQGWADVLLQLEELATQPHDYKTLCVDTIDSLEPLCWAATCANPTRFANNIEDYGFSKGYTFALDEWRNFRVRLERLQARGMNVILLSHAIRETVKNPLGDDFDAFAPRLHKKAAAFFGDWAHSVLFLNFDIQTKVDKAVKRAKGMPGTPARWIYTSKAAAYEAKSRYALPPKIALRWSEFAALVEKGAPLAPIVASINAGVEELVALNPALAAKAREALKRAGSDASKLQQLDAWISAKLELDAPAPLDDKPQAGASGDATTPSPPAPIPSPPSGAPASSNTAAPKPRDTVPDAAPPHGSPSVPPTHEPLAVVPPKRAGRPKGSKNKKPEQQGATKQELDQARPLPEQAKPLEKALERAASASPLGDALGKEAGPFAPDPGYVEDLEERVEQEQADEEDTDPDNAFPSESVAPRSVGDPRKDEEKTAGVGSPAALDW